MYILDRLVVILFGILCLDVHQQLYCYAQNCSESISLLEYNSLYALFTSTDGKHWRWNPTYPNSTHWIFPSSLMTPCRDAWQGLTCTRLLSNNCSITKIELHGKRLTGTIPTEIANLTALQTLDMTYNRLYSTIPESISEMSKLKSIYLAYNFLEKSLPSSIYGMTNLVVISVEYNLITGKIPTTIQNMISLEEYYVEFNKMSGTIPTVIGRIDSLELFSIGHNFFHGSIPTELGRDTNLRGLYLYENEFTGTIPTELGELVFLVDLWIEANLFLHTIPTELGNIPLLEDILVDNNYLTGTIPSELCRFDQWITFDVSTNYLYGTLPSCLSQADNMLNFLVNNNYFSRTIPSEYSSFVILEQFDVSANLMSGFLPSFLFQLTRLTELLVNNNALHGIIPTELGLLISLLSIDISQTELSGTIPTQLGNLGSLRMLNAFDTLLTGSIPSEVGNILLLEILSLDDNYMSGTIPNELGERDGLAFFSVSNNYFSGSLPHKLLWIDTMLLIGANNNYFEGLNPLHERLGRQVWYINLASNLFTGPIPSNWSRFNISGLQYMILDNNFLTGVIPEDFSLPQTVASEACQCLVASLIQFSAENNALTGSIPSAIGFHTDLNLLSLGSNELSGSVPFSFKQLINLVTFNLSQNFMSGSLANMFEDDAVVIFRNLTYLVLSNNSFSGYFPSSMFMSPNLRVISLSSNCFSGSIPTTICFSRTLQSVVINAASVGENCEAVIPAGLKSIVHGKFFEKHLVGSIPTCVWSITSLQTLQLAGNRLGGSLPNLPSLSSELTSLALNFNALTGSIPEAIQEHGYFTSLSLQNNKLTGTLSPNFAVRPPSSNSSQNVASNSTLMLHLHVNRLSGAVPSAFAQLTQIDVLNGNLFQCGPSANLPNDPYSQSYSCGSSALNTALYIWCAIISTFVLVILMIVIALHFLSNDIPILSQETSSSSRPISIGIDGDNNTFTHGLLATKAKFVKELVARISFDTLLWFSFQHSSTHDKLKNTYEFLSVLTLAIRASSILVSGFVVICMTVYVILKVPSIATAYSTHQIQYTWITSAAFLRGLFPAIFIFLTVVVCLFIFCRRLLGLAKLSEFPKKLALNPVSRVPEPGILANIWSAGSPPSEPLDNNSLPGESQKGSVSNSSLLMSGIASTVSTSMLFDVQRPLFDQFSQDGYVGYFVSNIGVPLLVQCSNFVATLAANILYLYLLQASFIGQNLVVVLPFSISIFKAIWCVTYIPMTMRILTHLSATALLWNQSIMYISVMIVTPLIAALYADQSCFRGLFFAATSVSSTYSDTSESLSCTEQLTYKVDEFGFVRAHIFAQCNVVTSTQIVDSSTSPPFIYSYQCGSSILRDFSPVLLYSYLFSLILPVMRLVAVYTSPETLRDKLPAFLYDAFISNTLLECDLVTLSNLDVSGMLESSKESMLNSSSPLRSFAPRQSSGDSSIRRRVRHKKRSIFSSKKSSYQLFDGATVVARRLLDFTVLFSYGIAVPLLGLAVAFNVCLNAFMWKVMVGKFLAAAGTDHSQAFRTLEYCSKDMLVGVVGSMWVVVFTVCIFWSMQLFDMVADVAGICSGLGIACTMIFAVPVCLYLSLFTAQGEYGNGSSFLKYFRFDYWSNSDVTGQRDSQMIDL